MSRGGRGVGLGNNGIGFQKRVERKKKQGISMESAQKRTDRVWMACDGWSQCVGDGRGWLDSNDRAHGI